VTALPPLLMVALVIPGCDCGMTHSPPDAGRDAGGDAGLDAAPDASRDAGRDGGDVFDCELPDASFRDAGSWDSGPWGPDNEDQIICFWAAGPPFECPTDRPFCCEFHSEAPRECRPALEGYGCLEQPSRFIDISCSPLAPGACPCELPWCCRSVCTDHALVGRDCYFGAAGPWRQ